MAKLYIKQNGSKVAVEIEMNGKAIISESFKKSEAIARLNSYFDNYEIDSVEYRWKTQGIGGAGSWSTLTADKPELVEHFKETYSWTFRDKRKAAV